MEALILVADRGGPTMFARLNTEDLAKELTDRFIGILNLQQLRAINRDSPGGAWQGDKAAWP
jgi:hypothetical protein